MYRADKGHTQPRVLRYRWEMAGSRLPITRLAFLFAVLVFGAGCWTWVKLVLESPEVSLCVHLALSHLPACFKEREADLG